MSARALGSDPLANGCEGEVLKCRVLWIVLVLLALGGASRAAENSLLLLSTTSTENSGLLEYLLPKFEAHSGIKVYTVAKGTGQTLRAGERGDGDVLLVHARAAEDAFVANGFGVSRYDLMYNDFVLVGPGDDPAGVSEAAEASAALRRLAEAGAVFASRGDDSGTHRRELELWQAAGLEPKRASGTWYRELGAGMGATLNAAIAMNAYTLTDRATWTSFKSKRDFAIQFEGDEALFNPYGIILVNPERHPSVKAEQAQSLIDWLISPEGQRAIGDFRIDGQQLFYPSARPSEEASATD